MIIMGSIRIYKGMPPLTVDYSDIPALTDEELKRFKPARLRKKNLNVAS